MTTLIHDAIRTPFGRYSKALAGIRPDDLASSTLRALLDRHPDLDPTRIDDVILGCANQAGEDNRNIARMALLLAGLPTRVPGVTVNRLCGSGLQSVIDGSRAIDAGDAHVVIAGGAESMSRAPWVVGKPGTPYPAADATLHSTTLGWRLTNPRMPERWTISLGESNERLAERFGIDRDEQDAYALDSHLRADAAWRDGAFDAEVVVVPDAPLVRDEGVRGDASAEALSALRPAFRPDGTITAGNSSPLSDGASMVLLASESARLHGEPLARITGRAAHGVDPDEFGIGPVQAAEQALRRAGRRWADVTLVELNEAFAAQALACIRSWPDLDPAILNVHGGAIAIGHPLGASGGRILAHAAHELARRGGGVAVVAICIGVGQGLALVIER